MAVPVTLTIRPMTLEDIQPVHEIDVLSFALPWSERSYHFELVENDASRLWVAETVGEHGRRIAGMLVLWLILDEAHIGTIAVHPDFRQQHVAQKLLAAGLIQAKEDGALQSLLEVRRGNSSAQALYQQFGFEVVGVRPRYYRDNGEDALLLTLNPIDPEKLRRFLTDGDDQPA